MMSTPAAAYGNHHWRVAMCNTPRQRSHQGLLVQSLDCEYQLASTHLPPFRCRRRLQWTASPSSCEDSKLREVRQFFAPNIAMRTSPRMVKVTKMTTHSLLTDTASCRSTSTELGTSSHNTTTKPNPTMPPLPRNREDEDDEVGVQELTVYEVNQLDRGSPMLLSLSKLALDWYNRFRVQPLNSLGDVVPFTNKIFDGSLKKRLGITAGIISVMRHYPKQDGLLFEAIYSFYFGDYGHISVKGSYKSHENTVLTVTGGSGIFTGVYGTVEIQNVEYPIVLFYKFQLYGIPQLPQALMWDTVPPAKGVRPSHTASMPGFALPNFTE